jgi:hypothetical protein
MPFVRWSPIRVLAVGLYMKIWPGIVLAVGLFSSVGLSQKTFAATPACLLRLEWQSSPDPTVTGYALYFGVTGGPVTNRIDAGPMTSFVMTNLTASTSYSFYVVAYTASQVESDPSNFFLYTAQAISSLKLSQSQGSGMAVAFDVAPGTACHVEYTDTLTPPNWKMLTTATGDSNGVINVVDTVVAPGGSRFYRAVLP